ncbi:MAG: hypothetical protein ACOCV2_09240, partial [Persicimonas sp.]
MMKSFKFKAFFTALSLAFGLCAASTATAQDSAAGAPDETQEQQAERPTMQETGEGAKASDG